MPFVVSKEMLQVQYANTTVIVLNDKGETIAAGRPKEVAVTLRDYFSKRLTGPVVTTEAS